MFLLTYEHDYDVVLRVRVCLFFFFKQKTAYELRISDWSSDVCSSDLGAIVGMPAGKRLGLEAKARPCLLQSQAEIHGLVDEQPLGEADAQIGRASCRERVCQYV